MKRYEDFGHILQAQWLSKLMILGCRFKKKKKEELGFQVSQLGDQVKPTWFPS